MEDVQHLEAVLTKEVALMKVMKRRGAHGLKGRRWAATRNLAIGVGPTTVRMTPEGTAEKTQDIWPTVSKICTRTVQ